MAKNYKRRGYPGKELKKQRKVKIVYSDPYAYPALIGAEKHLDDCEKTTLRNEVSYLKNELMNLKWNFQSNQETWNRNKKEHATLVRKIDRLKHHLNSLETKKETILRHTNLSRLIKNIG